MCLQNIKSPNRSGHTMPAYYYIGTAKLKNQHNNIMSTHNHKNLKSSCECKQPVSRFSITMKPYIKGQHYNITTMPLCDNYFLVVDIVQVVII